MQLKTIFAVAMTFALSLHCYGDDFTEEELNAGKEARMAAIKAAADKISALEKATTGDNRKSQIKQLKKDYNLLKQRTPEDFAAETKNPKPQARVEAPQGQARSPARPRTVEEIIADADAKRKAKAEAMRGLTVRMPYSRVWTPREETAIEFGICEILFDGEPPTQGFFKVGDETKEVVVESTDTQVVAPTPDTKHTAGPYYFIFGKPGKATITVRVGDYQVTKEVEVATAPVAPGDQTDSVIREMGLPTHKTNVFVKWPNSEQHGCFFYKPQPGKPFMGEHWSFATHQDLILSITEGTVYKMGTNRKRTANQIELRAELPDKN